MPWRPWLTTFRCVRIAVTGALGGLGSNVVLAAAERGHSVRALTRRDPQADAPARVEWIRGDANDPAAMDTLLRGCDALLHCVNVGFGDGWAHDVLQMLDVAIAGCRRRDVRLVFPANVWVFGRGRRGVHVDEDAAIAPCSAKGEARAEQERRIRSSGVRWSMLRLPEFYGPGVTTLTGPMFRDAVLGRAVRWFGKLDAEVEFVFMPDGARALVDLATASAGERACFHFPGADAITPRAFLGEVIAQAGATAKLRGHPPWLVRSIAPFSRAARGFADILHLWEDPILLDGSRYAAAFGPPPRTPYAEGITATLAWTRTHLDVRMHY